VVRDNILLGYVGDCCGQDQSIAVDQNNPNRIVVAAGHYYWYSADGGTTWSGGDLNDLGIYAGDPSLAFDSEGNVYLGSVSGYISGKNTFMAVLKSANGGRSWKLNEITNRTDQTKWLNDKEWVAVDTSHSQFHDRIYVVWDVFVNGKWNEAHNNIVGASFGGVYLSYSEDHGATFSKPSKLPGLEMYDLQIAIGRAGEVYLVGMIQPEPLEIERMRVCVSCKKAIGASERFCSYCGVRQELLHEEPQAVLDPHTMKVTLMMLSKVTEAKDHPEYSAIDQLTTLIGEVVLGKEKPHDAQELSFSDQLRLLALVFEYSRVAQESEGRRSKSVPRGSGKNNRSKLRVQALAPSRLYESQHSPADRPGRRQRTTKRTCTPTNPRQSSRRENGKTQTTHSQSYDKRGNEFTTKKHEAPYSVSARSQSHLGVHCEA